MAYTAPSEKRYVVEVEDLGLRLVVAGSTVAEMVEFQRANRKMIDEGRGFIVDVAGLMFPKIVEWNRPEPLETVSMFSLFDFGDLYKIIVQYALAVVGVADPLDEPSGSGEPSPEGSARMEASLASLSS